MKILLIFFIIISDWIARSSCTSVGRELGLFNTFLSVLRRQMANLCLSYVCPKLHFTKLKTSCVYKQIKHLRCDSATPLSILPILPNDVILCKLIVSWEIILKMFSSDLVFKRYLFYHTELLNCFGYVVVRFSHKSPYSVNLSNSLGNSPHTKYIYY